MSARSKIVALISATVLLLSGASAYGISAFIGYQQRMTAPSQVEARTATSHTDGPRIVFRNTAAGAGYGHVASVPLDDPRGSRTVSSQACDRVYQTNQDEMCLRIDRGIVTTFSATLYDAKGAEVKSWPLPGLPSRTRISPDSKLVAFTAFVTGEAYATVGFSTATRIAAVNGPDYGNLEDFALYIDGQRTTAADRNIWGVTFSHDDNVFYATAATNNHTYLVRGDLGKRTLTEVRETSECPSISPDGTRIAYKKNVGENGATHWDLAVLDLASNTETILPEKRSIDDQLEWLDDSTLLYGVPRTGDAGDSDVWSIRADGSAAPTLFIPHAWSPAVIRK
jgi:hypothetical protein